MITSAVPLTWIEVDVHTTDGRVVTVWCKGSKR